MPWIRARRRRTALLAGSALVLSMITVTPVAAQDGAVSGVVAEPRPVPGDPLTGSGTVSRTLLTVADLTTGTSTAPVATGAFAVPDQAAPPTRRFEGTLTLSGVATAGGFSTIKDPYGYAEVDTIKHLPPVSITLVQNGSHLIPTERGLRYTGSTHWNLAVGPGRAWTENGDEGRSRAAMPFALVERNANCVHNGLLTFLFTDAEVSQVRYQITSETCAYFQFDMWGQVPATYSPHAVADSVAVQDGYAVEVASRIPTEPISALATDYPDAGVDTSAFGAGVTPSALSTFGFLFNGVNYVGGCRTRHGDYPFCGSMLLPSYSTAKSAFAGVALMRLGQRYGADVYTELIENHVPEAAAVAAWDGVTFQHTLNMATGNYRSAESEADEAGPTMATFFAAEAYDDKMAAALSFPHKADPGAVWTYHTSDTFVATRAMNGYLQERVGAGHDIFAMLRDDVLIPAGLSADSRTSVRTGNSPTGAPFGGYGMFWTQHDLAALARLLNVDDGAAGGSQLLEPSMLDDAMQRDPANRGMVTTGTPAFRYNNGFWAKEFTSADDPAFSTPFHVPFMSGYGGITVALMPNGGTYYYVSDNHEFAWTRTVVEADKLAPMAGGGDGCAPAQLIGNGGFETGTAAPWTASPGVIDARTIEPARTGSWKAWLNGFGYGTTETLQQAVDIPAGCGTAAFTFHLRITTAETQPVAYDTLRLEAVTASDPPTVLGAWSNLDAADYTPRTFDLAGWAGETVTLRFTGSEDYSLQTSFVIDDAALEVG